jgi:hypothetical protein
MAYNKKAHLQTNIEAIRIAFTLDREKRRATEAERSVLQQYSGFGGLKCILNPIQDKACWTKSEVDLLPMVSDLHKLIRENSHDENEYKRYFNSLKSSILTAFYTPPEVIKTISDTLKDNGITPVNFLEPSAGNGAFADAFKQTFPNNETVCFEKDLLTGKILSHLHPDDKVHISGFEEIENHTDNRFDMIASNIPFGNTAVFDISFSRSNDLVKRQATHAVHNYFFLKGIETLREGGVMAFITSQGVMNSPSNEPVREWLMKNANLVSAIRLPNNLMSDNAGTEVGSDLIILQKNSDKLSLLPDEQAFIKSRTLSNNININNYFQDFSRVAHTKYSIDKDLYGRPGMIFIHEGGISGMATDMKTMLSEDISNNLNHDLYRKNAVRVQPQYHPTEQDLREMGEVMAQAEKEQQRQEYRDPLPEDYAGRLTREDMEEIDAALEAVRKGRWDEFVAARPYINGDEFYTRQSTAALDWEEHSLGLEDLFGDELNDEDYTRKSTEERDWEEHSLGFKDMFSVDELQDEKKLGDTESEPRSENKNNKNIQSEPLLTLYDLFGFSAEERTQLNTKKKGKKKPVTTQGKPVQLNMFSQPQAKAQPKTGETPKNLDETSDETSKYYRELK